VKTRASDRIETLLEDCMHFALPLLSLLMLLGSCTSPPKPPTVDESSKRPANSPAIVDLQSCRSDLQNTRILMNDSVRAADVARTLATQLMAQKAAVEDAALGTGHRNVVYSILFAFGSARIEIRDASARRLLDEARSAPLVLLRGRTDGSTPSASESRVARERAAAVQAWLVGAGVEHARIRTTWQPVGDHAADNALLGGRALNRRVEIEIYRAAPEIPALNQSSEDDHGR
jgi:outer membrane protein OmpA-like peptidoglycan-associated protein